MKQIVLSLAIVASSLAFGQKKEIANAVKAVDTGNLSVANTELANAEKLIGDKTYLVEPNVLEQYYYAKGLSLLKAGKTAEGAEILAKIGNLTKNKIYTGKDDAKNKVYFVGKEQADQFGNGLSLKEENFKPSLGKKLAESITPIIQKTEAEAHKEYTAKNYTAAGDKFKETYYLTKANGKEAPTLLYNAVMLYADSDKKESSIALFDELINSSYTGVDTNYSAVNIKTGQKEYLAKENFDMFKNLKDASGFKDFKVEQTEPKRKELYEKYTAVLFDLKKYDEAIEVANKGLKEFPNNQNLTQVQGLAYYKAGKTEEFAKSLRATIANNPNDSTAWYNLGVILGKDPSKYKEAEDAFLKVIAIDPANKNALTSLVYHIMGDDSKTVDDYNRLRKAGKIDEANKIMDARRDRFQKAIPYAEKLYALDKNDIDIVSLLKSFYNTTRNTAKFNEFKAIEASLNK